MLTLHQFEISPYCDKVRRILHVKGVPYRAVEVSLLGGGKVSPTRKLPCIEHEGHRIDDSTQIAHYLEAAYPEPRLVPKDARERALCHFLEDWADESLYFYDLALHFSLKENAARRMEDLAKHESGALRWLLSRVGPSMLRYQVWNQGSGRRPRRVLLEDLERHVASVGDWLGEGSWLVGDALSLADIAVFVQLFAVRAAALGEEIVARHPRVGAWMARVDDATAAPGAA